MIRSTGLFPDVRVEARDRPATAGAEEALDMSVESEAIRRASQAMIAAIDALRAIVSRLIGPLDWEARHGGS
jgi:hypothetical protein